MGGPLAHGSSPSTASTPPYLPVADLAQLNRVLSRKLGEYNDAHAIMNLVLFEQAMEHVARVVRILSFPRGNALLVGVGGSGKQSLARLSAFICGHQVVQLSVSSSYGMSDLREEIKELYRRAGVKPALPLLFLLSEAQIVDERFLVYVNDLLASGRIPDLFTKDEYDAICGSLRGAAKADGVPDSRVAMMDYFIGRVRANLHVVLCMSPVGGQLRARARRFPALVNCTSMDWFHEWPREALVSVAHHFLKTTEGVEPELRENISYHMAEVHLSVGETSEKFWEEERRKNFITPKSFLELIAFYQSALGKKRSEMAELIRRYDTGLRTLASTNKDVKALQEDLQVKMVDVDQKKRATDDLLEEMGKQRQEAEAQQAIADREREKADAAAKEARGIEQQAAGDLALAKPALEAAEHAVKGLDKASMTELKGFANPPAGVDKVTAALLILVRNEKKNLSWENAKKMMAKVDAFKEQLESFDGENIPAEVLARVEPYLDDPIFTFEKMKSKSAAAANLCNWVVNIVIYHRVYTKVKPLMDQLQRAQEAKGRAEADLDKVMTELRKLDAALAELQARFLAATEEKARVEEQARDCQDRLSLAERLTLGLAAENDRWAQEVDHLRTVEVTVVGDVLLSSAFLSYAGAFSSRFRARLWQEQWLPDLSSREIPVTDGVDPVKMLSTDAEIAEWMNEGLPADRISMENGAIITRTARWPLLIDPQLQGLKWVRTHEENRATGRTGGEALGAHASGGEGDGQHRVTVLQPGEKGWLAQVTRAIQHGDVVIIENLGDEMLDAVLEPLLSRAVFRKGRNLFLHLGGEDIEYDAHFRLYLQTKLVNPKLTPELSAQCAVVNCIVTEQGLEDQLLASVVALEQPQLEKDRGELVQAFNTYKIQLKDLEDSLLAKLANAPADILGDVKLIEGLEATKEKATEVNAAVQRGRQTERGINEAREVYRPVAREASLLYFLLLRLTAVDHMYQYSLEAFSRFFFKGMERAVPNDKDVSARVANLRAAVRWTVFVWVQRGLFDRHRLVFLTQLTLGLLRAGGLLDPEVSGFTEEGYSFLLRGPSRPGTTGSPVEWLSPTQWGMVLELSELPGFDSLARDLEDSAPRFLEWFTHVTPETERLPLDWRQLDGQPFRKLLVLRCLRPDRLTVGLRHFVRDTLPNGSMFTECDSKLSSFQVLEQAFHDAGPTTPVYLVLSKGADVGADVERLAAKNGMVLGSTCHVISLGQGQDVVAREALENAHHQGHWVVLNNVHLMPNWLRGLEKVLDQFATEGSHPGFRVIFSSDPAPSIPIGLLERCIRLTSDPPSGLRANLKLAFCSCPRDVFEDMEPRTRGILIGLCFFHGIMLERRKFGPMGFNMQYPFSPSDLQNSSVVLQNYMENAPVQVPWADLRYLFGEIMYGGHIVNDLDRLLSSTYLAHIMRDELLDEMELYPYLDGGAAGAEVATGFHMPQTSKNYDHVLEHVDTKLKGDSPLAFGLHPNAEIGFRSRQSEELLQTILDLDAKAGGGATTSNVAESAGAGGPGQAAEAALQDIMDQLRDQILDTEALAGVVGGGGDGGEDDDGGPFQNVLLQECERANALTRTILASLHELDLGLRGELTMTDHMEALQKALAVDRVPALWARAAFPSERPLGSWTTHLVARIAQLQDWSRAPSDPPSVVWITGLFNPQSFLTAIRQTAAQTQGLELDKLSITTEVTKKIDPADVPAASRDGAFIHGLSLEGARWNLNHGMLETALPRELFCSLPVVLCKAIVRNAKNDGSESGYLACPVYATQRRGPTYVFSASLRTKAPTAKWVMAGVAAVLDVA